MDINKLAKRIVDQATGEAAPVPAQPDKNKAAQELGRLGELTGGLEPLLAASETFQHMDLPRVHLFGNRGIWQAKNDQAR